MRAISFEQLSVTTSTGFTVATIRPTDDRPIERAVVTINSGQVRVRWDGTAPTASVGHLFSTGNTFVVTGQPDLLNCRLISIDSTTAEVAVSYFRGRDYLG